MDYDFEGLYEKNNSLIKGKRDSEEKELVQERVNKKYGDIKASISSRRFDECDKHFQNRVKRNTEYDEDLTKSYLNQYLHELTINIKENNLSPFYFIELMKLFQGKDTYIGGTPGEAKIKDVSRFKKEHPNEFKKYEKALAKRILKVAKKSVGNGEIFNTSLLDYAKNTLTSKNSNAPGLERTITTLTFAFIFGGLLLLSNNLTGNTIFSGLNSNVSFPIGVVLFVLGIVGFLFLKR